MSVLSTLRQQEVRGSLAVAEARPRTQAGRVLIALAWAAVAVAVFLRLFEAGGKSLWFDEVDTLATASHSWQGTVSVVLADNVPPLFSYALKLWMFGGASDWWLRTGPALLGVGVVILTWVVGRRMFDATTALVATALCALSAYEVYYAQYLRMYVALAFLALLSVLFVIWAVETNRRLWWALWALSAAACLYTFYYAIFLLVGEGLWLLALAGRRRELRVPIILWGAVAVLLYVPWLPTMLQQYSHAGTRAWIGRPTLHSLLDIYNQFAFDAFLGQPTRLAHVSYYLRDLSLIPLVLGLVLPGEEKERSLLFLILCCGVLLPIGLSRIIQPLYDPRYEVFAAAFFYLLVARGVVRGLGLLSRRLGPRVLPAGVAVALCLIVAGSYHPLRQVYASTYFATADIRGAIDMILRDREPGDVVVHNFYMSVWPSLWYAYHDGPPGPYTMARPSPIIPSEWVSKVSLMQVSVQQPFPRTMWWMPQKSGRLWLFSLPDFRDHQAPTAFDPWFRPDPADWRLVREITRYQGVLVRLYVRK